VKGFSAIGLVVLILGVLSLFVPIPHREREGFRAGGVSIGVETHRDETVSPMVSAILIVAGAGLLVAGRGKQQST
jgi:hypothetical protein